MEVGRCAAGGRARWIALAVACGCLIGIAGGWAGAQGQPRVSAGVEGAFPPAAAGYPVTGRVICGDTQRAARFAQVMLIPATEGAGGGGFRGRRLSARTDLDGNFVANGVDAGDYYVTAQMSGYVNEAQAVESALSAGGDALKAIAGVPEVHVGAGGGSTQLTLQRGAVIAGTVSWDDGSPAGGVQVSVQPAPTSTTGSTGAAQAQAPAGFQIRGGFGPYVGFSGATTDDRGSFRLSGLAPGSYVVRASVQAPAPYRPGDPPFTRMLNLSVYAPNKVRRTEATAITLAGAEERDDVAITIGLSALHTVSGTVGSSSAAVRSGTVSLTDQTDSSLNRSGVIAADGSFVVPYVPPGNYTLRVTASANAASGGLRRGGAWSSDAGGVQFQPLQESITVVDGDLAGLSLNVSPTTASQ